MTGSGALAPAVSVVTLLWRNESYAAKFVDSLREAAERADAPVELVVVVNGPEGTAAADIVREATAGDRRLSVQFEVLDENIGFAGGVNVGCRMASAPFLVVANLDLEFDPRFVQSLLSHPEVAHRPCFLSPLVHTVAADPASCRTEGPVRRDGLHRLQAVDVEPRSGARVPAANGSCLVFGRPLLALRTEAVGGLFDPEYHSYYEDVDLFWWAERAGVPTYYAPHLEVTHHQGGSFGGRFRFGDRSPDIRASVVANYRINVLKHARGPRAVLGWMAGEAGYVLLNVRAAGAEGVRTYGRSWRLTAARVRAIHRRRGGVR